MIISGWHYGYGNILPQVLMAVFTCVIVNGVLGYFKKRGEEPRVFYFSYSALITGLILSAVLAPNTSLSIVFYLALIAIISKYIFRSNHNNIFNPAALAIFIGMLFFHTMQSWWVSDNPWLITLAGAYLLYNLRGRWKMVFSFLITLIILISAKAWINNLPIAGELYLNIGTSFFFMFFMLTDPKTAPCLPRELVWFGVIAAIGSFLSIIFWPASIFILGLLGANVYAMIKKTDAHNLRPQRTAY
jgi:Na+-translocating ferredoxin:NAD+ oxidoreductase RnfD subunit